MTDARISRRTFVAAGVGAAVLAACGTKTKPAATTPRLRTFRFTSVPMAGEVKWAIAMPAHGAPTGVVVCLHYRTGNYRSAFDDIHVHEAVAARGLTLAVVGVDGGPDSYWHKRASGFDPQAMLVGELLPRVDQLLGHGVPRALLGWSMGGFGALLLGERHPELARAVVASSPALFTSAAATAPGAFDDAADYARNDVFAGTAALAPVTVRVDCGEQDSFVDAARAFAARLPHPNPGGFTPGAHDDVYWRRVLPAQLDTIAAAVRA